jgi:hypothetical protein
VERDLVNLSAHFGGKRTLQGRPETFVQPFTNALEWRCLDQIRAPIQELRVADLPHRASAAGGGR